MGIQLERKLSMTEMPSEVLEIGPLNLDDNFPNIARND